MMRDRTFKKAVLAGALLSLVQSCSSGDPESSAGGDNLSGIGCEPGAPAACRCADGTMSSQLCDATGSGFEMCQCGGSSNATGDLPCDVAQVLQENCWECHSSPPKWGAPMPLTSAAHFRAASSQPGTTVGQMAILRVNDNDDPMPELPRDRLTAAQVATLQSWVNGGAQSSACVPPMMPPTPTGTSPVPTGTSPTPTGTSTTPVPTGTGPIDPPPPPDPNETCYQLRAHAPGNVAAPYDVPGTPDLYQCFTFNRPWADAQVHLTSARSIIDNTAVLHHWILYNNTGAVPEGASGSCSGAHPDAAFIAGWAPGGEDSEMPPDVGLQVAGQGFTLEIHYNNTQGQQFDASGVEICVTNQLRQHTAAVHWLGTEGINGTSAVGTCDPVNTGPVTILSSSPHMHLKGRHMKTVINRAGGGQEVLIDKPFDFNTQVTYETPAIVNPGDTLTTTCTYASPATFGEGTNAEMCYNFVTAYPAGQLAAAFSFARQNGCTGL